MMKKNNDFESMIAELEGLVVEIEAGELTMSDMLKKHKSGMELIADCREKLKQAEDKLNQTMMQGEDA